MTRVGYFDWEKKPRIQRHFSEDFKRTKVRELEKRITSIADICMTCEVNRASVYKWIYR
jgi:transposase-like protein